MKLPATIQVRGIYHAIAVWRAEDGSFRYRVTDGPAPASEWRDVRDGWEPFKLKPEGDCHAAAYMACRDADPYDTYHTLRKALHAALRKAVRESKRRTPAAPRRSRRQPIKRLRGGTAESRRAAADWIKWARSVLWPIGRRVEVIHSGWLYVVRDQNGRGIMTHAFDYHGKHTSRPVEHAPAPLGGDA